MLDGICSDLKEIAGCFKLPVLFINQVSENIDEPMIHWAHRPISKKVCLVNFYLANIFLSKQAFTWNNMEILDGRMHLLVV